MVGHQVTATTYARLEEKNNPAVLAITKRQPSPEDPPGQEMRESEQTAKDILYFLEQSTTQRERILLFHALRISFEREDVFF